MKNLLTTLLIFLSVVLTAQNFKGEITYSNTYESKSEQLTNEQLTAMLGTTQHYFTKNGNYKSETNGTFFLWQTYINKENRLYSKMAASETVYWNDCSIQGDKVIKADIRKNAETVLGKSCDEITLVCESGIQKYYFNTSLAVNPDLFKNHKFGNWYDFISRSKAFPLKIVIENPQFKMTSIATKVEPKDIPDSFFKLPEGVKTEQSKQ